MFYVTKMTKFLFQLHYNELSSNLLPWHFKLIVIHSYFFYSDASKGSCSVFKKKGLSQRLMKRTMTGTSFWWHCWNYIVDWIRISTTNGEADGFIKSLTQDQAEQKLIMWDYMNWLKVITFFMTFFRILLDL